MTIKNILCAYSGEAAKASGLRHAIKLAKHHDAWVTGVLSHGRPMLERRFSAQVPESLLEALHEADDKLSKDVTQRFKDMMMESGLSDRWDFYDLDPAQGQTVADFARTFDLIVTGHHSEESRDEHLSANPDLIALRSGRPVLIVPDAYDAEGLSDHALVAWDGKRAAARAIGDAMPILEEKASVTLLTVGTTEAPGTDMLARNLERHGINVIVKRVPREKSTAHTVLKAAEEASAKLIVMGAFEHSKFQHNLFGGVTTDVMNDSPVPVFMAH